MSLQIEITPVITEDDAYKAAKACGGCNKECASGCPVNIRIPEFVGAIKDKDLEKAADIMYGDNPFPCLTGRLCSAKCEISCPKGIPIRSLERFVGDNFLPQLKKKGRAKKKVAIVGTGLSGMVVANNLIEQGAKVEMFEVKQTSGGFLAAHLPEFRVPSAVMNAELSRITPHVSITYDTMVGTMHPIESLSKDYDAVVIATGASKPVFGIKGEHLRSVFSPTEYKNSEPNGMSNAIVLGGTNHALESALVARSRGAQAMIVHDSEIEDLDVDRELLKAALSNGVQFLLLTKPLQLHGDETGNVASLRCQQMRVIEHEGGIKELAPLEDSEFHTECDHVVIARGYDAHPAIAIHSMLRQSGKQRLWTRSNGQTTIENVFAAGAVVVGYKHVEDILAHAMRVSSGVMEFLNKK